MIEWWRDPEMLRAKVRQHGTITNAARQEGRPSVATAQRAWNALKAGRPLPQSVSAARRAQPSARIPTVDSAPDPLGIVPPSSETAEGEVVVHLTNALGTDTRSPADVVRETTGLDPDEFLIDWRRNQWDVNTGRNAKGHVELATMHQLTVRARPKPQAYMGMDIEPGWVPPPARRRSVSKTKPRIIAAFTDPHFPLHEPELIEASVAWLEDVQPDEVVILGDVSDASPFKRHSRNPRTDVTVSQHQAGSYQGLARWRNAAPDARIRMLAGNHDYWLLERIREMLPDAEQLLSHPESDIPLFSLRNVLGLDSLRIEIDEPRGHYHDGAFQIMDDLVVIHGVKVGRDGAFKEQAGWEGASVAQGHAHSWQITGVTKRLPGGGESQRFAVNIPAMSRRDLGYAPSHNVSQGWMSFTAWPDGRWVPEMAVFDPQTESTCWRDWRYG